AVPLALFGAAGYGHLIGRIGRTTLAMQAIAPLVLAFVAEHGSDPAVLAVVAALAAISFAAFGLIRRPNSWDGWSPCETHRPCGREDDGFRASAQPILLVHENPVDVVLAGVPGIALELGAVEQHRSLLAGSQRRVGVILERVDAAPDLHHVSDALLDE